jgi:hypothetical protein
MDLYRFSQQERLILAGLVGATLVVLFLMAVAVLTSNSEAAQLVTPAVLAALPKPTRSTATPKPTRTPRPTNTLVVAREDYNRRLVQNIIDEVVAIRGLAWVDEVPFSMASREEMVDVMRELYSEEEFSAGADQQWLLYRTLGLVDEGFTVGDDAIEDWVDQFSGLYIPEHNRIYVVTDLINMNVEDEVVSAHEYTHALQDGYFDLDSYLLEAASTDADMATRALVEGDATVVMAVYAYGNTTDSQWDYLARQASYAEDPTLGTEGISERASNLLLFPYLEGAMFVVDLWTLGGWSTVDQAFSAPPMTSEQVLHPEKYLGDRDEPRQIGSPASPDGDWQLVLEDTLGEYVLSVHLDEFLDDVEWAADAAAGWDGDRMSIWQDAQGRSLALWQTAWDTASDAAEFEEAYRTLIPVRFEDAVTSDAMWFESSVNVVGVRRDDRYVSIVWGPDRTAAKAVLDNARP